MSMTLGKFPISIYITECKHSWGFEKTWGDYENPTLSNALSWLHHEVMKAQAPYSISWKKAKEIFYKQNNNQQCTNVINTSWIDQSSIKILKSRCKLV